MADALEAVALPPQADNQKSEYGLNRRFLEQGNGEGVWSECIKLS